MMLGKRTKAAVNQFVRTSTRTHSERPIYSIFHTCWFYAGVWSLSMKLLYGCKASDTPGQGGNPSQGKHTINVYG